VKIPWGMASDRCSGGVRSPKPLETSMQVAANYTEGSAAVRSELSVIGHWLVLRQRLTKVSDTSFRYLRE
jgi:hypothetical protein